MSQPNQSTVDLHVNTSGMQSRTEATVAAGVFPGNVNEKVRLALEYGRTAAPATCTHHPDVEAATPAPFTGREQGDVDLTRILDFPPQRVHRPPATTFHAIQEWEGYVVAIGEREFVAHLIDLTAGSSHEEEEAAIPVAELSDDEAAKMRMGSIFRWVIGYERSPAGTKKRVSQIVFRDLPAMTRTDLQEGAAWAQKVLRALDL